MDALHRNKQHTHTPRRQIAVPPETTRRQCKLSFWKRSSLQHFLFSLSYRHHATDGTGMHTAPNDVKGLMVRSPRKKRSSGLFHPSPVQADRRNGGHGVVQKIITNAITDLSPRSLYAIVVVVSVLIWIGVSIVIIEFLPNSRSPPSNSFIFQRDSNILNIQRQMLFQEEAAAAGKQNCHTDNRQSTVHDRPPEFNVSLRTPMSSSPYHLLHTVTTRFMIGQPHQPILARARYKLFETFCWPTMKYQSRQNFYWIVLVDPRLDPEVIADIQTLLTSSPSTAPVEGHTVDVHFPSQNAFLVLTDNAAWAADGVGVPNVTSYGVGLQELAREYRDGNVEILSGNTYHLMNALERLEGFNMNKRRKKGVDDKPVLLIETLLDADDGLNNKGIEWIQDLAIAHGLEQQQRLDTTGRLPSLNSTWWVLCGTDHIEWHNRDIYKLTESQYETMGLTAGITGVRHAPLYCASAGYTRVGITVPSNERRAGSSLSYDNIINQNVLFPKEAYSNHALAISFPFCNTTQTSACLRREFEGQAYALKSRSVTSDSMDHMNPKRTDYRDNSWENKTEHPLLVNETERSWKVLQQDFSISRIQAWRTSIFLREHVQKIVEENQASHCAPGFPCRLVADTTFKSMTKYLRLLEKKNEREKKGV